MAEKQKNYGEIEKQEHNGEKVWVRRDMEKRREKECLCLSCSRMKPRQTDHCEYAAKLYKICTESNSAFMMTRCKHWADPLFVGICEAMGDSVVLLCDFPNPWLCNYARTQGVEPRCCLSKTNKTDGMGEVRFKLFRLTPTGRKEIGDFSYHNRSEAINAYINYEDEEMKNLLRRLFVKS